MNLSMKSHVRGGAIATSLLAAASVFGSSHSDAPLIKQDPQANLTDVYAFIGTRYDNPKQEVLNVIVSVRPFSEPGDGPHYDRFADDALYSIHITNPVTAETIRRYDFEFSAVDGPYRNGNTILSYGLGTEAGPIVSIGDARQNYTQTYNVTRTEGGSSATIGTGLVTAPPNVGKRVTPAYNDADGRAVSGATVFSELDSYTRQATQNTLDGSAVFAGPRDDGFYADIPAVFDLLDPRILSGDGNGVDGFKGFNVLSYSIQIPLAGLPQFPYELFGPQIGVGVYASVSRPEICGINPDGTRYSSGEFRQVNRLANPVFNEALVALQDKDRYNVASPVDDAQFATYAENSELAFLINFVHGTEFQTTGRVDLVSIFIPDVLRVNTTTGPVPLSGQPGFSRLSFLDGDTTKGVPSGWPNGRRMGDDVVDIALTAVASGPTFDPITILGDNVNANDQLYNQVFPYIGTPHAGTFNRKDPAVAIGDVNGDGVVSMLDLLLVLMNWTQ